MPMLAPRRVPPCLIASVATSNTCISDDRAGGGAAGRRDQVAGGPQLGEREAGAAAGLLDLGGPPYGLEHAGRGVVDRHDEACRELAEWSAGVHQSRRVRARTRARHHPLELGARGGDLVSAVTECRLDRADVAGDAAEQMFWRLDDHAVLAGEVARAQDLQRVIRQRRRHVRTVRSVAQARNRPKGRLALAVVAVLVLLAVLAARATAAPAYDDVSTDDDYGPDVLDSGAEPASPGDPQGDDADAKSGATNLGDRAGACANAAGTAPDVREVIAAALRAAGLADDPTSGWRRRARLSALVPSLSVRGGRDDTWRDVADPTLGHSLTFGVTASWRFDHLVFEPTELRIASADVLRRRERRRLAWYVISLYRSWRRTGNDDLAAQLDVVTDGWFSRRLGRPTG